jgi:hypothetical protein
MSKFLIGCMLLAFVGGAYAQTSQRSRSKDPKYCSTEECIKRGAKMGYNASAAANWCSTNNNGCRD